jgi:hypothetical protein
LSPILISEALDICGWCYFIDTGEVQGNENMTDRVRGVLSLFDLAAGSADRENSLRPPNNSSFPRIPLLQIVHACFAIPSKFLIPFALPRDVTASETPPIVQMALSCLTQWFAAIGICYRDLELLAFRQRGLI